MSELSDFATMRQRALARLKTMAPVGKTPEQVAEIAGLVDTLATGLVIAAGPVVAGSQVLAMIAETNLSLLTILGIAGAGDDLQTLTADLTGPAH
jgi:hypothetical protein